MSIVIPLLVSDKAENFSSSSQLFKEGSYVSRENVVDVRRSVTRASYYLESSRFSFQATPMCTALKHMSVKTAVY